MHEITRDYKEAMKHITTTGPNGGPTIVSGNESVLADNIVTNDEIETEEQLAMGHIKECTNKKCTNKYHKPTKKTLYVTGRSEQEIKDKLEILYKKAANDPSVVEIRQRLKMGRNDICECGSGKKFKRCCMSNPDKIIKVKEEEIK